MLPSMAEIGKLKHLNEMELYGVVQDLGFYETRWILKFSFNHLVMNYIKSFQIWLKQP